MPKRCASGVEAVMLWCLPAVQAGKRIDVMLNGWLRAKFNLEMCVAHLKHVRSSSAFKQQILLSVSNSTVCPVCLNCTVAITMFALANLWISFWNMFNYRLLCLFGRKSFHFSIGSSTNVLEATTTLLNGFSMLNRTVIRAIGGMLCQTYQQMNWRPEVLPRSN